MHLKISTFFLQRVWVQICGKVCIFVYILLSLDRIRETASKQRHFMHKITANFLAYLISHFMRWHGWDPVAIFSCHGASHKVSAESQASTTSKGHLGEMSTSQAQVAVLQLSCTTINKRGSSVCESVRRKCLPRYLSAVKSCNDSSGPHASVIICCITAPNPHSPHHVSSLQYQCPDVW